MKTVIRFAFYHHPAPSFGVCAEPSYLVLESDIPSLPQGGNVCQEQILTAGLPIPLTPTYETWLRLGAPCFRGQAVAA